MKNFFKKLFDKSCNKILHFLFKNLIGIKYFYIVFIKNDRMFFIQLK
jgi:hypothetical protein